MLDGFLNLKKCSLYLLFCQLPIGAGNYFLSGSTTVMVTFALLSQYHHKVLCYRQRPGEESVQDFQGDGQKFCFTVVALVLTWLTTLQVTETLIPYSQLLRHKKQLYMN